MTHEVQVKQNKYICFLFVFLCCISVLTPTYCLARPPPNYYYGTFAGQVTDDLTDDPIENATVAVWTSGGTLISSAETDSNGYYEIEIERSIERRMPPGLRRRQPRPLPSHKRFLEPAPSVTPVQAGCVSPCHFSFSLLPFYYLLYSAR